MATITTRSGKGSALTYAEVDANFTNLNTDKPDKGTIVNADIASNAAISGSKIVAGTTSVAGVVQLTDSVASTSTTTAATPNSVKTAYDLANAALPSYTVTTTAVNKTLANRERCTVTASGLTITLPATPSAGWEVTVFISGTFTNTVLARNGSNIMSLAENMTLDLANDSTTLVYVDATRGWIVLS